MKYSYKARTKEGKMETGTIEAYSKDAAAALLQKYNVFVTSLEEQKEKGSFWNKALSFSTKVSSKDLAIFFRQLSVMLGSRVPVVQSLSTLAAQTKKSNFQEAITKIAGLVEEGVPLSDALAFYPNIFGNFYVNLIKSGEASGRIAEALAYVSESLERDHEIISEVRQAMIYPIFLVCVLIIVIAIVIVEVMPKIADLIKESTTAPSWSTVAILNFYTFLEYYGIWILIALFIIISALVYYIKTEDGKKQYDKFSLKIPMLGDFLKKVFLVRFCSNISTLLISGITIDKALKITKDTVNNHEYRSIISKMEQEVSGGEKMSQVMVKNQDYFPAFVVQMVKVGEETGKLDKVLEDVVSFYQKEIKRSIDLFSRLLEPIMIIILGAIVAMLAVSVFSSIYGSIGNL